MARKIRKDKYIYRDKEPKSSEEKKLKSIIRRLESDKRQLLSEVKTLTDAFHKNVQFLKGVSKDLTVEELIVAAKNDLTLKEAKEKKEDTIDDMIKKWECHSCGTGIMKLIILPRHDGDFYFRACNSPKCQNRTKLKPYNTEVTGVTSSDLKKKESGNKKRVK